MKRLRLISKVPVQAEGVAPEVKLTVLLGWLEATQTLFASKDTTTPTETTEG